MHNDMHNDAKYDIVVVEFFLPEMCSATLVCTIIT